MPFINGEWFDEAPYISEDIDEDAVGLSADSSGEDRWPLTRQIVLSCCIIALGVLTWFIFHRSH